MNGFCRIPKNHYMHMAFFSWAFSLMFLLSRCGYWQELIESIIWAHNIQQQKASVKVEERKK
jgi:hypothetical protein